MKVMNMFCRRFGWAWSKLALGGSCALSAAYITNDLHENVRVSQIEPVMENERPERQETREIREMKEMKEIEEIEEKGEKFLSSIARLQFLTPEKTPYFHFGLTGGLPQLILNGANVHFRDYSQDYGAYRRLMASSVVITCVYNKIGQNSLDWTGLKKMGLLATRPDITTYGNGIILGNENWKDSNIIATAYHVIAKYIDANGRSCDDNGIIVGTSEKTNAPFVYELEQCSIKGKNVEILSRDCENDIACIRWKGGAKSGVFMQVGDYIDDPMNAVIAGVTVHTGSYFDAYTAKVRKKEIERIFGQGNDMYVMGLRKDQMDTYAYPLAYPPTYPPTYSVPNPSIMKQKQKEPNKVKHYLFSLPGHSGSGISIEPNKVCCIHTGGSVFENEATIINETITQHLV